MYLSELVKFILSLIVGLKTNCFAKIVTAFLTAVRIIGSELFFNKLLYVSSRRVLSVSFLSRILPVRKKAQDDALTNKPLSKLICVFQSTEANLSSNKRSIVNLSGILSSASARQSKTVPSLVFN